jgi:signal recognition particle subunit SRP54
VVQVRVKASTGTQSVSASDVFVKICHDELVAMMTARASASHFASAGPTGIMMVGLQGAGKTTSCAKFANYLKKQSKKPLLVAADMQRPAAVEQLKVLGKQHRRPALQHRGAATPVDICNKGLEEAREELGCDVVIFDTAGRLADRRGPDAELDAIKAAVKPDNMLPGRRRDDRPGRGEDRLEGLPRSAGPHRRRADQAGRRRAGRRGAQRSSEVTGASPVYVGMGETLDKFEEFRADGMATRVLGMGDVVGLMKDFEHVIDKDKATEDAMKMLEGQLLPGGPPQPAAHDQAHGQPQGHRREAADVLRRLPADVNLDDQRDRQDGGDHPVDDEERAQRPVHALIREPSRVRTHRQGVWHQGRGRHTRSSRSTSS